MEIPIGGRKVKPYRGRIAPTPSGLMHLGHARTFFIAQKRADEHGGKLILRVDDLDHVRCRNPQYMIDIVEDLNWFGINWDLGPYSSDGYGELPEEDYYQSRRTDAYMQAWRQLYDAGFIYPSKLSRRDVERAMAAPHAEDDIEPIFPISLRPTDEELASIGPLDSPAGYNWRFRVPDGADIAFTDAAMGPHEFTAGADFGDFVVFRSDGICSYELAVVVDDAHMGITEVVRGADLLLSTARQLLLYAALGLEPPAFYHCQLVRDEEGNRLAKRSDSKSLRAMRKEGKTPEELRALLFSEVDGKNNQASSRKRPHE